MNLTLLPFFTWKLLNFNKEEARRRRHQRSRPESGDFNVAGRGKGYHLITIKRIILNAVS